MPNRLVLCLLLFGIHAVSSALAQEPEPLSREAMYQRFLNINSLTKGSYVHPNWMADGSAFWYRDDSGDKQIIYKVDPIANTRQPLFNVERLRESLTKLLGREPRKQGLPFDNFTFIDSEKAVRFTTEGKAFILQLDSHKINLSANPPSRRDRRQLRPRPRPLDFATTGHYGSEVLSPDGLWFATLKDHNVWLRSVKDGTMIQLTTDGAEGHAYALWPDYYLSEANHFALWAPDSSKLVVKKIDYRKASIVPLVDWSAPSKRVDIIPFSRADGPLVQSELVIIDTRAKQRLRIGSNQPDQIIDLSPGWQPDGSEFLFTRYNRSYTERDLIAANSETGKTRLILSVNDGGFLRTLRSGKQFISKLPCGGWFHFCLYDVQGHLIQQLTQGPWPVQKLIAIDEERGWVYFTALCDPARPQDSHLCRVDLQGKHFRQLTEESGVHRVTISPSKRFFLDRHSSVTRPPTVVLRSTDGRLLQTISHRNIEALIRANWQAPEEFVVKAADGKTDLYGLLWKPYDFDPKKKYPVLEEIYGTHKRSVKHDFGLNNSASAMAQLGFIVFKVDGRGTGGRNRKFFKDGLDGRHLVPDHVATLKQLATRRPYMDLTRVGIYGHSFGGYSTLRALLLEPDVYHVGVAFAPLVDMQDLNFFSYYLGAYDQNKAAFEAASNSRIANNLKGKLLIVHGTSDRTTPFGGVMRLIDALANAGKPYDLIVLPEEDHPLLKRRKYRNDARRRYFQEHLKPVPTAEIIRPMAGSSDLNNTILLHAKASASAETRVLRVEFLIDGRTVATDTEPPYQAEWKWAQKGPHQLTARVHDSSGRTEHSERVAFYVGVHGTDRTITSSTDDVEEQEDGSINTDSSNLQLTRDGRRGRQVIGLRFDNIAVPQDAKITRAYVQFTAAGAGKAATNLVIHADRSPDASPFKDQNCNVTSRLKADASVKWSPSLWAQPSEQSERQRTPDLSRIIQEIISQEDWESGNALVLMITGTGYRNAVSSDGNSGGAPMLHIECEP